MPRKGSIPLKRFYLTTEPQKKAETFINFHLPRPQLMASRSPHIFFLFLYREPVFFGLSS